jgi:hypothetical protein
MRVAVGLAALDALFPAVGYVFLATARLTRLLPSGLRLLGLSYLTGWAILGSTLTLTLIAGLDPQVASVVLITIVVIAICILVGLRRQRRPAPGRAHARMRAGERLVAGLGAAVLTLAGLAAVAVSLRSEWNPASDFDALWFWIPKAESIYYSHGLNASLWGSLEHPEYPPLAPTLDAVVFHFSGGVHPSLLPFQQTLLGIAFVLALLALLDRYVPAWLAFPAVAFVASAPWFWDRLQSTLPDQALSYLIAAAAVVCFLWLLEPRCAWIALAVPLIAAATLIKLEGELFASALVAVVILVGVGRHRRAALPAAWLVLGLLTVLPWHLWLSRHELPTSTSDYRLGDLFRPSFLLHRTGRLSYALHAMLSQGAALLGAASPFGALERQLGGLGTPLTLVVYLFVLVLVGRRQPALAIALGAWIFVAFAGLTVIYWIGRPAIAWYVEVTIRRVEPTIALVAAALLALLAGLALRTQEAELAELAPAADELSPAPLATS